MAEENEETPSVEVEVNVEEAPAAEAPQEEAPAVVVVNNESEPEEHASNAELDHERRLTQLEAGQLQIAEALIAIDAKLDGASFRAEVAEEVAAEAVAIAEEANEGQQAAPEEDSAPDREHGFFKPWRKR